MWSALRSIIFTFYQTESTKEAINYGTIYKTIPAGYYKIDAATRKDKSKNFDTKVLYIF